MFTIEMFSDEQVLAKYEANHQLKLKLEQERLDAEKANAVKTDTKEHSSVPVVNNVSNAAMVSEQVKPTQQARNKETQAGTHNSPAETQTVIMFRLVVTGRTQADHERLLPKFLEKINTAADVGLAPAVNAGFGYKFEVVE